MPKVPRQPTIERLNNLTLEIRDLPTAALVWRIYYRGGRHPTRWGDFRNVGPTNARFDHYLGDEPAQQERAVLCSAGNPVTCFAEVFQQTRVINRWHKDPWLVGFEIAHPVRLLDLTGAFPTRAGASMGLMTGPRSVSRNWAQAFYEAYPEVAGLYYPSSMHANQPAMVLTDRAKHAGIVPTQPSFHRSLGDPAILTILKNAAHTLGYVLN